MLEDRHHLTKVTPGENNHRNVYPIPPAWVRINYDQLDPTHGIGINPPAGSDRVMGYYLVSDTTVISRIWGNSQDDHLSVFYYKTGTQINKDALPISTGSHDTTDVDISF